MFVHVYTFIIMSPFSLLHLFAGLVFVELPSCIVNIHWRFFFFRHLFMLEAFYKLTNFCMKFLSHFFVIASHLGMILNERNENAITL